MTVIQPPTPGEDVQILAPHKARVLGQVERREHERFPVELEFTARTLSQPASRLTGNTVDLSPGGALLRLPDLSGLAVSLDLSIALADGPLRATAEVRWPREDLVGVQFQDMSPDSQIRLVEFLRRLR
jgi:hypothetical protein